MTLDSIDYVAVSTSRLDLGEVVAMVADPRAGATSTFSGTTRDNHYGESGGCVLLLACRRVRAYVCVCVCGVDHNSNAVVSTYLYTAALVPWRGKQAGKGRVSRADLVLVLPCGDFCLRLA